jgi:RNA polymerase sigma-70 factor (ECF subfamily)
MEDVIREFTALMERVRAGDQEAARELYERYNEHVQRIVRWRLEERLRRQYDSMDLTQSVWASFFDVPAQQYTFGTPEELVAFLSRLAYNKVIDTRRKQLGTTRRGAEEHSLDEEPAEEELPPLGHTVPASTPTPSQYVMADERWQGLLRNLPPGHRRILELLREGHSQAEIADRLAVDRKAVQRLIDRLRDLAGS